MKLPYLIIGWLMLLTLLPRTAAQDATWSAGTEINGVRYHPIEELRSFYKLNAGTKTTRKGAYGFGDADVSLELGPGSRELSIGGVMLTLARPLQQDSAGNWLISREDWVKWVDPILRPTYIAGRTAVKTVIIDPGHGGHDAGVSSHAIPEADITLRIAHDLKEELEKQGLHVILTRSEDQFLSDQQRVATACSEQQAIFLSLHLNSGRSDFRGSSVYTVAPAEPGAAARPGNAYDASHAALAYALQNALIGSAGTADAGCHHAHFSLLSSITCPAVWVELGYATHAQEGEALTTDAYQRSLARALAQGIATYAHVADPATQIPVQTPPPRVPVKQSVSTPTKTTTSSDSGSRNTQKTPQRSTQKTTQRNTQKTPSRNTQKPTRRTPQKNNRTQPPKRSPR